METARERVLKAVNHEQPERVPVNISNIYGVEPWLRRFDAANAEELRRTLAAAAILLVLLTCTIHAKERGKVITTGPGAGHYLQWDGKPILPIGDSTTQGWMESGTNFNQTGYLDALSSRGINVAMIWSYIATDNLKQIDDARIGYDAPEIIPWQGSTQGNVADLRNFNQAYFDRLSSFVAYAENKDILVLITVHDGWTKTLFNRHPFNSTQGNGPLTSAGQYVELADYDNEMPTTFNPTWNRQQQNQYFQERFADKLITELNGYSNVMYEMFNEGEWYDQTNRRRHEEHFLKFFSDRTDAPLLTNSDHISGDDPHNNPNVDIISFHGSSWTGEHNQFVTGFNTSPPKPYFMSEQIPDFNGQNVSIDDIRQGAWELAMAGAGWVAQNDTSFGWDPNTAIASQAAIRDQVYGQVGHVATFFNKMGVEFWKMAPDPSLSSTGVVLAEPGSEYVVYTSTGGTFTVDLSAANGKTLIAEWYNPRTGELSNASSIAGGSSDVQFTTPNLNDWVLRLHEAIPGDANGDDVVDLGDLTIVGQFWKQYAGWSQGDFNGDGYINLGDLTILGQNWKATAVATSIPEPSSLAGLLGVSLSVVLCFSRRKMR